MLNLKDKKVLIVGLARTGIACAKLLRRYDAHVTITDNKSKEMLKDEIEQLNLLDNISYPVHKKAKTRIMFQRIIGRAMLSKWEYHTLMGVLKKARTR